MTGCIGAHHGTPPLPEPGLHLCRRCLSAFRRDLADIVALWAHMADLLEPGTTTTGGSHGKPGSRAACDLDVVDILEHAAAILTSWARVVIEDRQLAARSLDGEQAARLLAIHSDWLAAQPFADEAIAEIHEQAAWPIRRKCRDLDQRWVVGTCVMPGPDGQACGGVLQVEVRHLDHWDADADSYDRRSAIDLVCRRCRDTWTEADLDGYMIVNDIWLPIDDAAYQLGVSRRTLDRHAVSGVVRRRRGMVSWADARAATQQRGVQ